MLESCVRAMRARVGIHVILYIVYATMMCMCVCMNAILSHSHCYSYRDEIILYYW